MTDRTHTIAYIVATAMAVISAYHAGRIVGFINGHRRGRSEAITLHQDEDALGWGDLNEWQ